MHKEVIVIGATFEGVRTALTAAEQGKQTLLVGAQPLTDLSHAHFLSVSSLLVAAHAVQDAKRANILGVVGSSKLDFARVIARAQGVAKEVNAQAVRAINQSSHVEYVYGSARFIAKKVVEVEGVQYSADAIIIATGTSHAVPPVPGLVDVPFITEYTVLQLTKRPKHVVILGGGRVACELATFFACAGSQVTLVERSSTILGGIDSEAQALVAKSLDALGVRVLVGTAATQVSYNKQFTIALSGAKTARLSADALLVATGRTPNSESLNLFAAGVKINGQGHIVVDAQLRTSNKSVYAVGGVNGRSTCLQTAKHECWLALEHALFDKRVAIDYSRIPLVMHTEPSVGVIGLSEAQARKQSSSLRVLRAPFSSTQSQLAGAEVGFMKVFLSDGALLGAVAVGLRAEELIHVCGLLMQAGPRAERLLREAVFVHPSFAEVFSALR